METTTQLSDVLKLGKRLVAELEGDESRDTLSQWMAHHIASLMNRLEKLGPSEDIGLEVECRRAILDLWSHRHSLRGSSRPFSKFDQLLATLEALNPDSGFSFYFRELGSQVENANALEDSAKQWLDLARSLDRGARTLIGYCISRAAAETNDKSADWVELAQKVESSLDADIRLVRIVIQSASALKDVVPQDGRSIVREMLQRRVDSLDGLAEALAMIRGRLNDRVQEIDSGSTEQAA